MYWGGEDRSRILSLWLRYLRFPKESSWWFELGGGRCLTWGVRPLARKINTPGEQSEGKVLSPPESRDKWIKMRLGTKGM